MINSIFLYFLIVLISFIPIVIWGYTFSYIDNNEINKKRFFIGILGGVLSVFPVLYMGKIIEILKFKILNVFYFISNISDFFSSLEFGISLSLLFIVIITISFILGIFLHFFKRIFKVYLKNTLIFLVFILLISLIVYILSISLNGIDFQISSGASIKFGNIMFNSFKLILFYYLLVAFLEETTKHFNFLQSSILHINSIKIGVLYAVFVALGFSLVENVLYIYNFYVNNGGVSGELVVIYFLRSIFSVIVHVLCSSIVGYYFSKALLLYRENNFNFSYLKIFSYGIAISILLHLIYDVALTLGFSIIMFIYFIGGYLYVSSIFYRE